VTLLTGWTPILYYGQEIGMTGDKLEGELPTPLSVSADDVRDIPLRQAFRWHGEPDFAGLATWYTAFPDLYPVGDSNRPGDGVSVAEQDGRPGSLLETYRALAALRARHPALGAGTSEVAARSDDAVVLIRRSPSQMAYVAFNFGSRRMEVSWGCGSGAFERVYGEAELRCNDARAFTTLDPYEVAVWIQ
jgi:glycosidase